MGCWPLSPSENTHEIQRQMLAARNACNIARSTSLIRIIYKTSIVVIFMRMTTISPNARALAALGHDARLSIFRLLVKAGDEGLRVSDIGEHLGLAPSTLAHHLSTLVDAGLVLQDRQGREVFNRVDYPAMRRVVGFLTSECCSGVTVQPAADAA